MRFPVVSQSSFLSLFDAVWLRCFKGVTESPLPPHSPAVFSGLLSGSFPSVFLFSMPFFPSCSLSCRLPYCSACLSCLFPGTSLLYILSILSSFSLSSFSLLSPDPWSANPFLPCLSSVPGVRFSRQEKTAALLSKNSCRHDPVGIAYASCAAFSSALSSSTLSRCSQGRSTSVLPKWP